MRNRTALVGGALMITVVVSLSAVCAVGQGPPPEAASPRLSPEVNELLQGTTLTVDPDEPVEAVKAYVETMKQLPKALGRIRLGPNPEQPDVDPDRILNDALGVMRAVAARYPTSRHTWQGLGDVLWLQYEWRHKAQDLREAVDVYRKTIGLTLPRRDDGRDFSYLATRITQGLALLKEPQALDAFMRKLEAADQKFQTTTFRGQALSPYAQALAMLRDPRADAVYQELMAGVTKVTPDSISSYVEYLFEQGRYQETLQLLGKIPPSELSSPSPQTRWVHLVKGATLERLSRLDEAKAEYQAYLGEVTAVKGTWFYAFPANEKFRIRGSVLQQGIEFGPDPNALPEPQSSLRSWLLGWFSPRSAWADQQATPCASTDWFCKARYYLVWTIDGEAGCVNTSPYCIGTTGGQRAVAWNVRTRVFSGWGNRQCFGATQYCFNYAAGITEQGDLNSVARRYWYVIDQGGYGGLRIGNYTGEAEQAAADVALYGRVPDPITGLCLAGVYTWGDACNASCNFDAGWYGSFLASQSGIEFRSTYTIGQWVGNCWYEIMVPSDSPSGSACGTSCFAKVGPICPKYGWLIGDNWCGPHADPYWGPKWGNYYWRFNR